MNKKEAIKRIQLMLNGTSDKKYFLQEEPESSLSDIQIRAIGLFLEAYPDSYVKVEQKSGGLSHYVYTTMFIRPREYDTVEEVEQASQMHPNGLYEIKKDETPRLQLRLADSGSLWLDGSNGYQDYRVTFLLDVDADLTIFKHLPTLRKLVQLANGQYRGHPVPSTVSQYKDYQKLYQQGRGIFKQILSGKITEEEGVRKIDVLRGMMAL